MKNVQISFDEKLLEMVDKHASSSRVPRSALVRDILKDWLRQKEINQFESEWIKKLKAHPDSKMSAEDWLEAETWGEE